MSFMWLEYLESLPWLKPERSKQCRLLQRMVNEIQQSTEVHLLLTLLKMNIDTNTDTGDGVWSIQFFTDTTFANHHWHKTWLARDFILLLPIATPPHPILN
jgi:hypothetical protein